MTGGGCLQNEYSKSSAESRFISQLSPENPFGLYSKDHCLNTLYTFNGGFELKKNKDIKKGLWAPKVLIFVEKSKSQLNLGILVKTSLGGRRTM